MMGGDLTVQSEFGKGATLHCHAPDKQLEADSEQFALRAHPVESKWEPRRGRILQTKAALVVGNTRSEAIIKRFIVRSDDFPTGHDGGDLLGIVLRADHLDLIQPELSGSGDRVAPPDAARRRKSPARSIEFA